MRIRIRHALVLAWASVAGSASAQELPVFEFRGIVAGTPTKPEVVGFKRRKCEDRGADLFSCTGLFDEIAGMSAISSYTFFRNQLARVTFDFEGGTASVMAALEARYGQPCRTGNLTVQNRAGAVFNSPTTMWCFRTGMLQLKQIGIRIGYSSLEYVDSALVSQIPRSAPKVDF